AKGGPDGGKGGEGGDIIFEPSTSLQTLLDLKIRKTYKAQNGVAGKGKNQTGRNGKDTVIKVPQGTLVFGQDNNLLADVINKTAIVAKGGKGGLGNKSFSTSRNRTPRYSQPGLPGDELNIKLELRLIAEVGLIGLPNAGKSTLLKSLTKAHPKIAAYPFTTLHPNLGVLKFEDKEIILADIPGLIAGAADGVGLGHDFLRHIDRTKFLVHMIELIPDGPKTCWENFQTIQKELGKYSSSLLNKRELIVLNKTDLVSDKDLKKFQAYFKKKNIDVICISAHTGNGLNNLKSIIYEETNVQKNISGEKQDHSN
ncbi:Obg family GTPase CgtA, partial [Candidatus Margulisiibacteriota bacterium]